MVHYLIKPKLINVVPGLLTTKLLFNVTVALNFDLVLFLKMCAILNILLQSHIFSDVKNKYMYLYAWLCGSKFEKLTEKMDFGIIALGI